MKKFFLLVVLCLVGCSSASSKYEKIHEGMTLQEVEELLGGTPDEGYQVREDGCIHGLWRRNFDFGGMVALTLKEDPATGRMVVVKKHLFD